MIVQVKLADSVWEQYKGYKQNEPEMAMAQQLTRFAAVSPVDRVLLLPQKERAEIEQLLGGYVGSAKELVGRIKELMSLRVEGVDVKVNPETLMRLNEQAEFEGEERSMFFLRKVDEALSLVVNGYVA